MVSDRVWWVQISPSVMVARTPLNQEDLPDEYEAQFYSSWIAESEGEYDCKWIIFDIDNADVEVSLIKTRMFVEKLITCVPREAVRTIFSTNKGFHVYLDSRVVGLEPSRALHGRLRRFCLRLLPETDASLYSPNRILALPNSVHRSTGLYYAPIPLEHLWEWGIPEMLHHAQSPHEMEPRAEKVAICKELQSVWKECEESWKGIPSLSDLVECRAPDEWSGWQRGNAKSNERLFKLSKRYREKELSSAETFVLLSNINTRIYPPFTVTELRTIVNSAYKLK